MPLTGKLLASCGSATSFATPRPLVLEPGDTAAGPPAAAGLAAGGDEEERGPAPSAAAPHPASAGRINRHAQVEIALRPSGLIRGRLARASAG